LGAACGAGIRPGRNRHVLPVSSETSVGNLPGRRGFDNRHSERRGDGLMAAGRADSHSRGETRGDAGMRRTLGLGAVRSYDVRMHTQPSRAKLRVLSSVHDARLVIKTRGASRPGAGASSNGAGDGGKGIDRSHT
jgi:hypothetical protein